MARPTITLCLIAKNEAENLPRLFESFKGCFDEVHLTDTGSTDSTVDVARSLGASVFHFPWIDDFAAARNASIANVKTDYWMWLDCDDVLENSESFLRFRDTAMELADYWMSTYHYSSNEEGKAVCSFVRERVFRTDRGFRWKYFVHEGVVPDSALGQAKVQYIPTWVVRHKRTEADLSKDRSRNLTIFEKNRRGLDARMTYYYGKELFESGRATESVGKLLDAVSDPSLDMHDRVLGIQYACYAFMQLNDLARVHQLAQQGIALDPNRAEFYCLNGDAFVKEGKLLEALPSYAAAKACQMPGNSMIPRAIFSDESAYGRYPSSQMARIYFHTQNIEAAEKELTESYEKYKDDESKALLAELHNVKAKVLGFSSAIPCEDIVISTPPMNAYEWDGEIYRKKAMGGSETAAIEMAEWMHKLSGRKVKVFNMRTEDKTVNGVEYISSNKLVEYMATNKPWLHVAWRHNIKVTDAPTVLWCHDLFTQGAENTQNYIKHLCLTPFHKRYVQTMQGIPDDKIWVTRNGLDPEKFKGLELIKKDPNKFVFPSSPDRGLDRTMRVLDKVRLEFPDIKLHVFYGIEHLPQWGHQALHDKLKIMMAERPWVIYHGKTEQSELIRHFAEASVWLHACDFIESSCISAMEIISCGVYPVTRRLGGLMDTLAQAEKSGMATLIDSDCVTEREYDLYAKATLEALREKKWEKVKFDPKDLSWESVAKDWLSNLPSFFVPAESRGEVA